MTPEQGTFNKIDPRTNKNRRTKTTTFKLQVIAMAFSETPDWLRA
jgi:hypothetical protein